MKLKIKEGTTSKIAHIFIQDSSQTDGRGLASLVYNSAGLTWYWIAEGDASSTSVTLATATVGTYTSGGFIEVDATNMPGVYEIGIPDAAIDATSEGSVSMILKGATNMAPVPIQIELDAIDYQDGVRGGMTALPNANADAAGGLPISDAGNLDLDTILGRITGNVALASVLGALTDSAADGDPTTSETVMQYLKQVINTLEGSAGIPSFPSSAEPDNAISLAETIRKIHDLVNGIASAGGGAISYAITEDNTGGAIKSISFVGTQTGTFANVSELDGTNHQIDDTSNEIDIVYGVSVGGGRTGAEVIFDGFLNGGNDDLNVLAYNFSTTSWDQIGTLEGQSGTTNQANIYSLLANHTGTGADIGKVYVRFQNTGQSNPDLNVDRLWISAVQTSQTVGYANGSVWVDTSLSNTNTTDFVDGVADNPVSTIAAAITIAGSVGLKRITFAAGSSVTLAADMSNYELMGQNWTLAFGGQTISNAKIVGATVSGTFVGTTAVMEDCIINAITGAGITMRRCFFNDVTITANGAGTWALNDCTSRVAGTNSPNFDFGAGVANTDVNLRRYSGGIEIENMGDTGTDTLSLEGMGALTLNSNCDGGSIALRGTFKITDNSGNVTIDRIAAINRENLVGYADGAVWLDTNASNTNTESYTDGTADNPVSTIAAAQTILGNVNLKRIRVISGSSVTIASSQSNCEFFGENWTLALGGQAYTDCHVMGATVSGTATGTGLILEQCIFDSATTLPPCIVRGSFFGDTTITVGSAGNFFFNHCIDRATGLAAPNFDFGTAVGNTSLNFHDYHGAIEVENMGDTGTDDLVMSGNGRFIGNANCTSGTVTLLGAITDTDNSSNLTITKALSLDNIWTEVLTESYASDGSNGTATQLLYAIQQFLHERAVSGTTSTVKQLDGSTTAMTFTHDDASYPTSITRAT